MGRRAKLVLQGAAVTVVALFVVLLGWQVFTKNEARGIPDAVAAGKKPKAPEFELPVLGGEGTISLASLRGKAVVLNFWASWCAPCKDEAPLLEAAWERYRDQGIVVLGIDAQDFRSDAKRFIRRYGITYPNVHDGEGSTLGRYGVTGFPETWFLDREGRIVDHVPGQIGEDELSEGISLAIGS